MTNPYSITSKKLIMVEHTSAVELTKNKPYLIYVRKCLF